MLSFQVEEATRIGSVPVLRVWSSTLKTHGLVSVVKKKYFCFCCEKNHCNHVQKIKHLAVHNIDNEHYQQVLQELVDMYTSENETSSNTTNQKIICHSYKKIPFGPTEMLTRIFSSGIVNNIQRHDENLVFIPKETICKHCSGDLDNRDPIINEWIANSNVTIVTNTYLGNGIGNI